MMDLSTTLQLPVKFPFFSCFPLAQLCRPSVTMQQELDQSEMLNVAGHTPKSTPTRFRSVNPKLNPDPVPVGQVRLLQTSSVQDVASLAFSSLVVHLPLDGEVRHAASRSVPRVGGFVGQTDVLH